MPRYFIEVSYKGSGYAGFQVQMNANTIQAEIEKALTIFFKSAFMLTGSSRTDAGVHALSNYFHFDSEVLSGYAAEQIQKAIYNLNAILPRAIVINRIYQVPDTQHCRFDAITREYRYFIYKDKNPFLEDRAYYYPYPLDVEILNEAAAILFDYTDFTSFSKRNTQVKNFNCKIVASSWSMEGDCLVYTVQSNRFLRGMVRGLVGTMLKVGTGKCTVEQFRTILEGRDGAAVDFAVPAQGLFLLRVNY